jgi:RecA-family ATPase
MAARVCSELFDQIRAAAREHSAKLVVLDTLADIFPGNENDRGQARQFVQTALGRLARELDCAVIVLARPSRSGQNRGSGESDLTGWIGAFRSLPVATLP